MESFEQGGPNDSRRNFNGSAVDANEDEKDFVNITGEIACVNGGSGYPRKLRSRTRVQKAAQVARRMGRSFARGYAAHENSLAREAREGISGFAAKRFVL